MTQNIVTSGDYYSAAQLAEMKLPGKPTSKKQWYAIVESEKWEYRDVKSSGRNGQRREYMPPPAVLALIEQFKAGTLPTAAAEPASRYTKAQATRLGKSFAKTMRDVGEQQGAQMVNVSCLARLLDAIDAVATRIGKPLTTRLRVSALVHAYRTLRVQVIPDPNNLVAYMRLGPQDFEAAATLALSDALVGHEEGQSLVSDPYGLELASL